MIMYKLSHTCTCTVVTVHCTLVFQVAYYELVDSSSGSTSSSSQSSPRESRSNTPKVREVWEKLKEDGRRGRSTLHSHVHTQCTCMS